MWDRLGSTRFALEELAVRFLPVPIPPVPERFGSWFTVRFLSHTDNIL